jgi:hypothetical protein
LSAKVLELEKQKKAAAMEEDFETAMMCKKQITQTQGQISEAK